VVSLVEVDDNVTHPWKDDTAAWTTAKHRNSLAFIAFLEHLFVECYPTGFYILVLDNASIHKSAVSLAVLSLFEHRVKVILLYLVAQHSIQSNLLISMLL
jgi:hypothetical protein